MKKIIVALDGLKLSESSMQTAIAVTAREKAHLVGVFLDDFTHNSFSIASAMETDDLEARIAKDKQIRDNAVKEFETACQAGGINFTVRRDKSFALPDLLRESIYADLLIVGADETFTRFSEAAPTRFVRDLLSEVQCPVLIAPLKWQPVEKTVMLYDGAPSSVFAIKMFSAILPETNKLPATVITVRGDDNHHVPENHLMKEFMKRHNPNAAYEVLQGDAENAILDHLLKADSKTLVVLGAYQRSTVSRWFKASMADLLMKAVPCALFIAHNK
ncbi:universal stress protein [Chitinophaga rhizosphaerae]|uniref:universal stress protein n=1 Tax=Chitinophaga rhizosphaerae TaxID=1864947 RepID=UPI000F815DE1|nr:universal stress protein [Chitinophaga rhizosphaerae]